MQHVDDHKGPAVGAIGDELFQQALMLDQFRQ